MPINVLVNGAKGRMGQIAVKAVLNDPALVLVGETGKEDNLAQAIKKTNAQVVVDVTSAETVYSNTETILEAGAHPVIGTSGLKIEEVKKLQARAKELNWGGVIAPNFSIGAVLMMKYSREFSHYFPDVEIIEMHHDGKLDSPSGTAMRTAEIIAETRDISGRTEKKNRETVKGARGSVYQNINIHSIRLPGLVAHQQIIFGGVGETLSIRHDTIDRNCFMPGIVLACKKAIELNHLVYGLEEIL